MYVNTSKTCFNRCM